MPYIARGKCVYKKDTGKKVGCTKGSVKKYLAALHANADESIVKEHGDQTNYDGRDQNPFPPRGFKQTAAQKAAEKTHNDRAEKLRKPGWDSSANDELLGNSPKLHVTPGSKLKEIVRETMKEMNGAFQEGPDAAFQESEFQNSFSAGAWQSSFSKAIDRIAELQAKYRLQSASEVKPCEILAILYGKDPNMTKQRFERAVETKLAAMKKSMNVRETITRVVRESLKETNMPRNQIMWWGYLHANGTPQLKRWFGDRADYTSDCQGNPFVRKVIEPFPADTREKAEEILKNKLGLTRGPEGQTKKLINADGKEVTADNHVLVTYQGKKVWVFAVNPPSSINKEGEVGLELGINNYEYVTPEEIGCKWST